MGISLDFSSVQGYDPLPKGGYIVRIEKVEETTSQSGNAMLNMAFEVLEGEYASRKIFENYVLKENCLWKLQSLLAAVGVSTDGVVDLDPQNELLGKVFIASVEVTQYNGQDRNNVSKHEAAPDEFTIL